MARIYDNSESPSRYFGGSLQLTNWILDSGATCHMTPQVSDFIPGSIEDTDKMLKLRMGIKSRQRKKNMF